MCSIEKIRRVPTLIMVAIVLFAFIIAAARELSSAEEVLTVYTPQETEEDTVESGQYAEQPVILSPIRSLDFGADDTEILLRIAMAEAEGECTEGKALVMLVVLNRVWSNDFPDSIEDVVFQKTGGTYQFSPVAPGGRYWTKNPNEDCYKALYMVLDGWNESSGALYFEGCNGDSWHSRNLEYLFTVGGHRFYK